MKTCKICQEAKELTDFGYKGKYINSMCKVCRNEQQREYRMKISEDKLKRCTFCKEEKSKDEFYVTNILKGIKYYNSRCKCCIAKDYRDKHPKKIYAKKEKFNCVKCKKGRTEHFINKKTMMCNYCTKQQDNKLLKSKSKTLKNATKEIESIFEFEKRLKKEGKVKVKEMHKTEEWKLQNGYSWVTVEVQVTKTTTRKQRVLRKVNK